MAETLDEELNDNPKTEMNMLNLKKMLFVFKNKVVKLKKVILI